jgi:competence protein ComEC
MLGGVVAMLAGGLATIGAPPLLATIAGLPGWLVLHLIVLVVRVGASLPFAAVTLPPGIATAAGAAAGVAVLCAPAAWPRVRSLLPARRAVRRPAPAVVAAKSRTTRSVGRGERFGLVGVAIVIAIAGAALGDSVHRETRLTVLDVGQGDSILLETRTGARMLVDGGPDPDRVLLALDERIPPWDRRLDVLVLTHPHEDHVAGLARILERYRVGRVFEPGMRGPGPGWAAWSAELHDGPPHGVLSTGAHLRLGEVELSVLWPDPGSVPRQPPDSGTGINNASVVFLGEANGRRFLLMGDVEQGIDPTLLARGLPRVDVLKIAHHGSRTATTQAFVDAVRPRIAIASAGAGNPYGHPTRSTLDRVRASGARVYRTDQDGSVEVDLRTDGLVVRETGPRVATTVTAPSVAAAFLCAIPIADASPRSAPALPYPPLWSRASRSVTAWASPTGYDPDHDHPRPSRGRQPAALARPVGEVRAARHGDRRHRRLPRVPCAGGGAADQPAAGRDGGAAPRRRQAGLGRGAGPPPAR